MGINCGAKCAKYLLFIFNIIFFLGGAAVLGVGIWVVVDTGSYMNFLNLVNPNGNYAEVTGNVLSQNVAYVKTVAYVLIGVGSFVFVVGFMGCCGAIKQWRPLIVTYAILLIIIMIVQIALGIYVGVYREDAAKKVTGEMQLWAKDYGNRQTSLVPGTNNKLKPEASPLMDNNSTQVIATNGWNAMQVYLQCCGATSYLDFAGSPYWERQGQRGIPPVYCCAMSDPAKLLLKNPDCYVSRTPLNSNMNLGCIKKVEGYVTDNAPALIGVAVGIGMIELFGVIFAFCLCCAIGDKERRYN